MINTSSYKKFKSVLYKTFSISGDRGKCEKYHGECYPQLAPKLSFWRKWHDNIGLISEEENTKFYIREYYKQVLSKLNPEKVHKDLNNSVLLCYEDNNEFCHRHIVSAWLELFLNEKVNEVALENGKIVHIEKPQHIKQILEEIIKTEINMKGFTSLRAVYLFEKSEYLEAKANELEKETGRAHDAYRQAACYLRCDADEAEAEYRESKRKSCNRK